MMLYCLLLDERFIYIIISCNMSNFTIPDENYFGKGFAIAGLALVAPACYFFRMYSRVLDYVQMFYIFSLVFAVDTALFSNKLFWSFLTFMPSFLGSYCQKAEFMCKTYGHLLSAAAAWFGGIILMFILLKIGSKNKHAFYHFYKFWKGFNRWFMPPLIYFSTEVIITKVKNGTYDNDFYCAAGICGVFITILFAEVIGYKNSDLEHETSTKWVQFFSNFRIISIMALIVVYKHYGDTVKYFIYGVFAIYDLVFLAKYKSSYPKCEKFFFLIGQIILVVIFSFYLFKSPYIYDGKVDFMGLAVVIALQIFLFLPKLCSYCKQSTDQTGNQVYPEESKRINRELDNPYDREYIHNNSLDYIGRKNPYDNGQNGGYDGGSYGNGRGAKRGPPRR